MESDLQESKAEIAALKEAKAVTGAPSPQDSQEYVSRQEFLREQYASRKRNLILMGLEESEEEGDERSSIATTLQQRLKIPAPKIEMTYRIGATKGKSPRPVLIRFATMPQRHKVWYKKGEINKDQDNKLWLQEDLPKALRDDLNVLQKIQKCAKSLENKYPDVKIKDFQLKIEGKLYSAKELHLLPDELKPAAISTPQNAEAVAFFGRSSPLSNHHLCQFVIAGRTFNCVEQFLAWQRANVAEKRQLADQVLHMKDPSEHKRTLNALRDTHKDKWEETVDNVLRVALKAKFSQNPELKKFLCHTHPKKIGEASLDTKWGIGLSLKHPDVLDTDKWNQEGNGNGNRLGKALEYLRAVLLQNNAENSENV